MRVMAVDPGSKRVGLAMSDPTGTIAQALATIPAEPAETLPARLAAVARAHEAQRIVVGLPLRLDGTHGPEAAAAERSLIAGGVRRAKRRLSVDRVAATILLQGHLDAGRAQGA